jgi:two-component system, LytTR family, sensor histidine kinase AlgZ
MQSERAAISTNASGNRWASGRAYYISQLAGWSLYAVLLSMLSPPPRGAHSLILSVIWCGTGLLGTHLLRWYVIRRRWQTIPKLIPPFAIAALTIAAAMSGADLAVSVLVFQDRHEFTREWVVLAHYFQAVLVISVWCTVFLIANEAKRRRMAEVEALQSALIAQVAQFRALRSQLNPHFLFNCLNSLRELIEEDRDRAKQVIDLLSGLLRYTLRADRLETVSLEEELRAVQNYLSLEKIRFEERLRIHFDVDPQSLQAKLPPMVLQTLAENGVKHGIARLPGGGEVRVVTQVRQGSLLVEVTNTGQLSLATGGSSAVGLDNARERLRLMYGEGASLTLSDLGECEVCASLVIPLRPNGVGS